MNRLKEIRERRGLVLMALTVRSGVSATTLSAVERHNYLPALETRERIAAALGVGVEDIWPSEDRQPVEASA